MLASRVPRASEPSWCVAMRGADTTRGRPLRFPTRPAGSLRAEARQTRARGLSQKPDVGRPGVEQSSRGTWLTIARVRGHEVVCRAKAVRGAGSSCRLAWRVVTGALGGSDHREATRF